MAETHLRPETEDETRRSAEAEAAPHFEDLTLAEALGQLLRAPGMTLHALCSVASAPRRPALPGAVSGLSSPRERVALERPVRARPALDVNRRTAVLLGLRLTAYFVAWWGTGILANTPQRTETGTLSAGIPFLILGFLTWSGSELYADWPQLRRWWARRRQMVHQSETADEGRQPPAVMAGESLERQAAGEMSDSRPLIWTGIHPVRVMAGAGGLLLSLIAWRFTADNLFTFIGFWSWMASILLWVVALSPENNGPLRWVFGAVQRARQINWRSGTVLALAAILLLGAAFRLSDLNQVPPEMTSDHVEKILDSVGVLHGQHNVFFANNGGREPFQMYAMALFAQLPGLGFNHFTLKLLSAIEGLVAILALYWMGREVVGAGNRRLGNWVGLTLAALVAVSYWHTVLSRLGLRIVLTTIVAAALFVFLARALRHNRREDFVKAGLVLGLGLYTYQAVRMLPVVILVGVGLAFLFRARRMADRGRYLLNLTALVAVAFVCFVPLFGYWLQFPDDFWRRTQGRLLGDDIITTTDDQGQVIERHATLQERWEAFQQNLPILTNNFRNTLLMFNWKGDVAWINGAPNEPAMDTFTGALLIVGLAAWLARMIRRRDVFDWLVPLALLIMLMPSALSIAYPVENPSHTRTSGALPEAYLIAALPLALMAQSLRELITGRRGMAAATGLVAVVVLGAYTQNTRTYFVGHQNAYLESSLPYSEAGRVLRGFAESDGSYGNAFMMAYPHWWDHRALGINAGRPDWPNGVVSLDSLRDFLLVAYQKTDDFRLDPDKDLLFFIAAEDDVTRTQLQQQFPSGRLIKRQSYQADDQYDLYRVPALGEAGFLAWVASQTSVASP